MNIRDEKGRQRVVVRLFTEGRWENPEKKKSEGGFTCWLLTNGGIIRPRHFKTAGDAVNGALKV